MFLLWMMELWLTVDTLLNDDFDDWRYVNYTFFKLIELLFELSPYVLSYCPEITLNLQNKIMKINTVTIIN